MYQPSLPSSQTFLPALYKTGKCYAQHSVLTYCQHIVTFFPLPQYLCSCCFLFWTSVTLISTHPNPSSSQNPIRIPPDLLKRVLSLPPLLSAHSAYPSFGGHAGPLPCILVWYCFNFLYLLQDPKSTRESTFSGDRDQA